MLSFSLLQGSTFKYKPLKYLGREEISSCSVALIDWTQFSNLVPKLLSKRTFKSGITVVATPSTVSVTVS